MVLPMGPVRLWHRENLLPHQRLFAPMTVPEDKALLAIQLPIDTRMRDLRCKRIQADEIHLHRMLRQTNARQVKMLLALS